MAAQLEEQSCWISLWPFGGCDGNPCCVAVMRDGVGQQRGVLQGSANLSSEGIAEVHQRMLAGHAALVQYCQYP